MPREDTRLVLMWQADEGTTLQQKLILGHNSVPIQPWIGSGDPMDDIERMPHTVWLDSPQLPGLTERSPITWLPPFWTCKLRRN